MHLVRYLLANLQWKTLRSGFYGPVLDLGCNNYIIIFFKTSIYLSYHIILYYIMASILSKQLTQSVPSTSSSSFCGFTMLCQWETCGLTSAGPLAHSLPKTQDTR
jgi:hypothetical protein